MRITIDIDDDGTTHTHYTWPSGTTPKVALKKLHHAFINLGRELVEGRRFHGEKKTTKHWDK